MNPSMPFTRFITMRIKVGAALLGLCAFSEARSLTIAVVRVTGFDLRELTDTIMLNDSAA